MRKIYSLLRMVFAAALLFGSSGIAKADYPTTYFLGEHTMTATVEYPNGNAEILGQYLPATKTFTISGNATQADMSNFIGYNPPAITLKPNTETGKISIGTGNLGSFMTFDPVFVSYSFYIGDANGQAAYGAPLSYYSWELDETGHIIVPDFTVTNGVNGQILAKYTNVKIDGYPGEGGAVIYPVNVNGEYSFNANVEFPNSNYNGIQQYIPSSFSFTMSNGQIDNFYSTQSVPYSYNSDTGVITITGNVLGNTNFLLPGSWMGVELGLADADGTWPGFYRSGKDIMDWTVVADGTITIPEFTIVDRNNDHAVIARFTNVVVTKTGESDEPEIGEMGDFVPTNPDISSYEIIGKYTLTITPIENVLNTSSTKGLPVDIQVEVKSATTTNEDNEDNPTTTTYYMYEVGGTDYFKGSVVPFTMQGTDAVFEQFYAGTAGDSFVWFSAFVDENNVAQVQPMLNYPFTEEDGFTFAPLKGFAWYESTIAGDINPTGNSVSAFVLDLCSANQLNAEDPEIPEEGDYNVIGTYNWTIRPTDVTASTSQPEVQIQVEVRQAVGAEADENGVNNYYIAEVSDTNYFNGYNVPFVYRSAGNSAEFTAEYIGQYTGSYIWFACWVNSGMTEFQNNFPISYNPEDGFTFTGGNGFGWFTSSSATTLSPQNLYSGFYLVDCEPVSDTPGTIPTTDEIIGTYSFAANSFELEDNSYELYYKADFDFEIYKDDSGRLKVADFFYKGSQIGTSTLADNNNLLTYDEETGVLTFDAWILRTPAVTGTLNGIAPNGEWGGITAAAGKKFSIQFNADGTISTPAFDIITYYGSSITNTIAKYNNIQITKQAGSEGPGGEEGPIVANEAIEGLWTISWNDPYFGSETGASNGTTDYEVTLNGNTVNFMEISTGSSPDREGTYHIIGKFTNATTIEFSQVAINKAVNPLNQVPFINTTGTSNPNNLESTTFSAIFNEEDGTLTFPEGAGFLYGNFNPVTEQLMGGYQAGFDIVSVTKTGELPMILTISNVKPAANGDEVTVTFNIDAERLDIDEVASWKAFVTGNGSYEPVVTVEDGVGTFTISGLADGEYIFSLQVAAYDEDGEQIVMSNSKDFTATVGVNIEVYDLAGNITVNQENGDVTMNFQVLYSNIQLDKVGSATATLLTEQENGEIIASAPATLEQGGNATISFWKGNVTFPGLKPGEYESYLGLNLYDEEGELIATTKYPPMAEFKVNDREMDPILTISAPVATPNYDEGTVVVEFTVVAEYMPEDEISYKVVFTPNGDQEEDIRRAAANSIEVDATVEDGVGTAVLTGLLKGSYSYNIVLNAYNAEGEIIASSSSESQDDAVSVDFTLDQGLITGVEGINAENGNVRYFNLQGVEIANPEKGAILIKVEGNKASKVIVK